MWKCQFCLTPSCIPFNKRFCWQGIPFNKRFCCQGYLPDFWLINYQYDEDTAYLKRKLRSGKITLGEHAAEVIRLYVYYMTEAFQVTKFTHSRSSSSDSSYTAPDHWMYLHVAEVICPCSYYMTEAVRANVTLSSNSNSSCAAPDDRMYLHLFLSPITGAVIHS